MYTLLKFGLKNTLVRIISGALKNNHHCSLPWRSPFQYMNLLPGNWPHAIASIFSMRKVFH